MNLLDLLLWLAKVVLLARHLTVVQANESFGFIGHGQLTKVLKSQKRAIKMRQCWTKGGQQKQERERKKEEMKR